jgi:hypothetical protein
MFKRMKKLNVAVTQARNDFGKRRFEEAAVVNYNKL